MLLKNLSLKITKLYDICFTNLIHYYKMENDYVFFIIKIFFACYCKDFDIFFAILQRMKIQIKLPVYSSVRWGWEKFLPEKFVQISQWRLILLQALAACLYFTLQFFKSDMMFQFDIIDTCVNIGLYFF